MCARVSKLRSDVHRSSYVNLCVPSFFHWHVNGGSRWPTETTLKWTFSCESWNFVCYLFITFTWYNFIISYHWCVAMGVLSLRRSSVDVLFIAIVRTCFDCWSLSSTPLRVASKQSAYQLILFLAAINILVSISVVDDRLNFHVSRIYQSAAIFTKKKSVSFNVKT